MEKTNSPFYYIDYTLAQICTLPFWKKPQEDYEGAWIVYLHLCKLAGSLSFLQLVEGANLVSPFVDESVASVTSAIEKYVAMIDDQTL